MIKLSFEFSVDITRVEKSTSQHPGNYHKSEQPTNFVMLLPWCKTSRYTRIAITVLGLPVTYQYQISHQFQTIVHLTGLTNQNPRMVISYRVPLPGSMTTLNTRHEYSLSTAALNLTMTDQNYKMIISSLVRLHASRISIHIRQDYPLPENVPRNTLSRNNGNKYKCLGLCNSGDSTKRG